jgi:hypothetical protein
MQLKETDFANSAHTLLFVCFQHVSHIVLLAPLHILLNLFLETVLFELSTSEIYEGLCECLKSPTKVKEYHNKSQPE